MKTKKITLTKKEYNALVNNAYIQGYEMGKKQGEQDAFFKNHTINDVRKLLGMTALNEKNEETQWQK